MGCTCPSNEFLGLRFIERLECSNATQPHHAQACSSSNLFHQVFWKFCTSALLCTQGLGNMNIFVLETFQDAWAPSGKLFHRCIICKRIIYYHQQGSTIHKHCACADSMEAWTQIAGRFGESANQAWGQCDPGDVLWWGGHQRQKPAPLKVLWASPFLQ